MGSTIDQNKRKQVIEQLQEVLNEIPTSPEQYQIISSLIHQETDGTDYEDPHLPFITNFPSLEVASLFNLLWTTYVDMLKSDLWFKYLTRELKFFTSVKGERAKQTFDATQPKIILGKVFESDKR